MGPKTFFYPSHPFSSTGRCNHYTLLLIRMSGTTESKKNSSRRVWGHELVKDFNPLLVFPVSFFFIFIAWHRIHSALASFGVNATLFSEWPLGSVYVNERKDWRRWLRLWLLFSVIFGEKTNSEWVWAWRISRKNWIFFVASLSIENDVKSKL